MRHNIAIQRLSVLLQDLSIKAKKTDELNANHKSHWLIENNNLFSQHLFCTESDQFSPYITEVIKRLNELSRLCNSRSDDNNKAEFAMSALLKIEEQISALMNAMHSNQAMHQGAQASFDAKKNLRAKAAKATQLQQSDKYQKLAKTVLLTSHQLYQQLSEHHEFERRLMVMITEREQQRLQSKNTNNLSQEVLALHQRLGRCRKAITAIERNIEIAEKSSIR